MQSLFKPHASPCEVSTSRNQRTFLHASSISARAKRHAATSLRTLTYSKALQNASFAPAAPAAFQVVGNDNGCKHLGEPVQGTRRRDLLLLAGAVTAQLFQAARPRAASADDFVMLPSGIKLLTIREGEGAAPQPGDTVVVHWAGFTKGYQGKRIDNTSIRDEPYEFKLGAGQAIPAFELAVQSMRVGGIARVEVPGELPQLGYPLDRSQRFTGDLISPDLKIYKYRYGPQPSELGGQRALDFVLDNPTLRDFNRTLLLDIKLLAVRRAG